MSPNRTKQLVPDEPCKIGLMSRIDFPPGEGYRQALLEQAAQIFKDKDVNFIVLAGGLISEKYVKDKTKKLTKRLKDTSKRLKELRKAHSLHLATENGREAKKLEPAISKLADDERRFQGYLDELKPEEMAKQLAERLPHFVNAKGETVKLYVTASPAFDGDIGQDTAEILSGIRRDICIYQSGGDRLPIKQAPEKTVEVVVPEKSVWMRSDYHSTPVERVLKDRRVQSSSQLADIYIVGCFGSAILKPAGELPRPYVSVPALNHLQRVRVNENQIGVRVLYVYRDRTDPDVEDFPLKDFISSERSYVHLPKKVSPTQLRLLKLIKEHGWMSTGMLAEAAGITQPTVQKSLSPLVNRNDRRPKGWPGLRFDSKSKRWGFDGYWLGENLRFPPVKTAAQDESVKIDSIVTYSCLHAGSIHTDYRFYLDKVVKTVMERGSRVLVGAGDFVNGDKHGQGATGENHGGMNITNQERLAGRMIAKVTIEVFRQRLELALKETKGDIAPVIANGLLEQLLLTNVVIPGNHDLWSAVDGHTPLVVMKDEAKKRIVQEIDTILIGHDLHVSANDLMSLVDRKFIEPDNGEFLLPSGLKLTVMHPHMGRAKTTSLRPQEMLAKAHDSQLVIGGNFHVGEIIELWDPQLGQRVCVEVGTIMNRSDFEDNKLKTVDHSFAWIQIESRQGRLIATSGAFISKEGASEGLNRGQVFDDLVAKLNI